jgi:hypothetical protein
MPRTKTGRDAKREGDDGGTFGVNAQHGMNRTGVEVEAGREFDDYEGAQPIDPSVADDRERDEGPEIRERARVNGYLVEEGEEE